MAASLARNESESGAKRERAAQTNRSQVHHRRGRRTTRKKNKTARVGAIRQRARDRQSLPDFTRIKTTNRSAAA
jgi:hypothetical protein